MMKIVLTTTLALGALCIVEMNQPAHATLSENIYLARGRGGMDRGAFDRGALDRGERSLEDRGAGDRATGSTGAEAGHTSNVPTSETPVERTLGESNAVHDRTLNNNLNRGADWGSEYGVCVTVDAEGNCITSQTTGTTTTIN